MVVSQQRNPMIDRIDGLIHHGCYIEARGSDRQTPRGSLRTWFRPLFEGLRKSGIVRIGPLHANSSQKNLACGFLFQAKGVHPKQIVPETRKTRQRTHRKVVSGLEPPTSGSRLCQQNSKLQTPQNLSRLEAPNSVGRGLF